MRPDTAGCRISVNNTASIYSSINNQSDRFIPVVIKKEFLPVQRGKENEDLYLWYKVTDAFCDSLPPAIGNAIRKEYKALLVLDDPKATPKEKAAAAMQTSCKYFEECRNTVPDMTDFKVYPNPATDAVTVEFSLNRPTECSMLLCNIAGQLVKTLKSKMPYTEGQNQVQLSLSGLPSGMFILVVRDKNGNMKTQRVIKQ